jgi:hypothetical protein
LPCLYEVTCQNHLTQPRLTTLQVVLAMCAINCCLCYDYAHPKHHGATSGKEYADKIESSEVPNRSDDNVVSNRSVRSSGRRKYCVPSTISGRTRRRYLLVCVALQPLTPSMPLLATYQSSNRFGVFSVLPLVLNVAHMADANVYCCCEVMYNSKSSQ